MIVLDASAVIDGLLDPPSHADIAGVLSGAAEPLAAPDLIDLELISVLRRWEHGRQISTARARQALEDLQTLPIIRYPARALLDGIWALRHSLTAYDAAYVALAQALPAALLTTDTRMAGAAEAVDVALALTPPA